MVNIPISLLFLSLSGFYCSVKLLSNASNKYVTRFILKQISAHLDVILDRFSCESDPNFMNCNNLKVQRVDRSRLLFGNLTYLVSMDDSYTMRVNSLVKQGGEYRYLPYKSEGTVCRNLGWGPAGYKELTQHSTFPYPLPCPIPSVGVKNLMS
jgi:hypothetical protein